MSISRSYISGVSRFCSVLQEKRKTLHWRPRLFLFVTDLGLSRPSRTIPTGVRISDPIFLGRPGESLSSPDTFWVVCRRLLDLHATTWGMAVAATMRMAGGSVGEARMRSCTQIRPVACLLIYPDDKEISILHTMVCLFRLISVGKVEGRL